MNIGTISRLVSILLLVVLGGGCARAPQLIGVNNPEISADSVVEITKHRMFLMSTRDASDVTGVFYSSERAPELGLASVDATVPPTHVPGVLERPKKLPPDPRTEFTVINPAVYANDASFIADIDRELMKRPPGDRKLLIFIHGFNNTTSDATLRGLNGYFAEIGPTRFPTQRLTSFRPKCLMLRVHLMSAQGSKQTFAATTTNDC